MPPKKAASAATAAASRTSTRNVAKPTAKTATNPAPTTTETTAKEILAPKKSGVAKTVDAPKAPTAAAKSASKKSAPAKRKTTTTLKTTTIKKTIITKKAPVTKTVPAEAAPQSNKRKFEEEDEDGEEEEEEEEPAPKPFKRQKISKSVTPVATKDSPVESTPEPASNKATKAAPKSTVPKVVKSKVVKPKAVKPKLVLNTVPTQLLDIYVFGCNESGELGLGDATKKTTIPRPVANPKLSASAAGVVNIAAGGMHGAVLTRDNKILTWGVNDNKALGRDTTWEAPTRDMDAEEESDSEDEDIVQNPRETTPTEIDLTNVPAGVIFTQIVASDSATFAVTDEGLVYGWGTVRVSFQDDPVVGTVTNSIIYRVVMAHLDSQKMSKRHQSPCSFLA